MTSFRPAVVMTAAVLLLASGCRGNGGTDAGDAVDAGASGCAEGCPTGERCLRDRCFAGACGSNACAAGEVCEDGGCVTEACAGLSCPGSTRCLRGRCFEQRCGDVPCEAGAVCDGARCVEAACAGLQCGEGTACRAGACTECLAGFVPVDGGCARPQPPGGACEDATQCETGVCAGGVCCLTPCLGQCEGCDELGQCRSLARGSAGQPPCFPGRCGGERLGCIEDCVGDGDCAAGAFCDRSGPSPRCLPALSNGARCARDAQCGSGFCVSGVCCDEACQGECTTCNGLTSDGFPAGTTPGTCSAVPVGSLPRGNQPCGEFLCDGFARTCPSNCGTDRACIPSRWCGGSPSATCANPKMGNGAPCDRGRQCTSGSCVDGVCCISDCSGDCASCAVPGREGLCSGETGSRSMDGGYCVEGVPCREPCEGVCQTCVSGACRPRTDTGRNGACGNFACRPEADAGCYTTCIPNTRTGCPDGLYCEGPAPGRCVLPQLNGSPCDAGAACQAGECCNGRCAALDTVLNCGQCGNACNTTSGATVCLEGACCDLCDGQSCADIQNDRNHCGSCWNQCPGTDENACSNGSCCETCGGDSCVDFNTSLEHCGSCASACGTECINGQCQDPGP